MRHGEKHKDNQKNINPYEYHVKGKNKCHIKFENFSAYSYKGYRTKAEKAYNMSFAYRECLFGAAGYSAEIKYSKTNNTSFEHYESLKKEWGGKLENGSDYYKIGKIADDFYKRALDKKKFIHKICRWIDEIMEIPEMWGFVEDTAKILIKKRFVSRLTLEKIALKHFSGDPFPLSNNRLWKARLMRGCPWVLKCKKRCTNGT